MIQHLRLKKATKEMMTALGIKMDLALSLKTPITEESWKNQCYLERDLPKLCKEAQES